MHLILFCRCISLNSNAEEEVVGAKNYLPAAESFACRACVQRPCAKTATWKEVFWLPVELHPREVVTSTFVCVILLSVGRCMAFVSNIKT